LGRCIAGYSDVLSLNIISSESFTRHNLPVLLATHFVGDNMEGALSGVQTSIYSVVALLELSMLHRLFFYTDGSLIDGCAMCRVSISLDCGGRFWI
jgi:hypothetical protein